MPSEVSEFMRIRPISLLLGLVILAAACSQAGVGATASGVLTIDGKPAPAGIMLEFQPQVAGSSPSMGITDTNGRYVLKFNVNTAGVMPGDSVVSLSIPPSGGANGAPKIPDSLAGLRLPKECVGPNSKLIRTVKRGSNTIDIAIDTTGEK
jgi:hypothetical protein